MNIYVINSNISYPFLENLRLRRMPFTKRLPVGTQNIRMKTLMI